MMFDFSFILLNFGHNQRNMFLLFIQNSYEAFTYIWSQIPWQIHLIYTTNPIFEGEFTKFLDQASFNLHRWK